MGASLVAQLVGCLSSAGRVHQLCLCHCRSWGHLVYFLFFISIFFPAGVCESKPWAKKPQWPSGVITVSKPFGVKGWLQQAEVGVALASQQMLGAGEGTGTPPRLQDEAAPGRRLWRLAVLLALTSSALWQEHPLRWGLPQQATSGPEHPVSAGFQLKRLLLWNFYCLFWHCLPTIF